MMKRPIPTDYVARTIRAADRRGIDLEPALRAAGIRPALLTDPDSRVTPEQATAFTQAVWTITGDELGGLGAAPVPRGSFRLVTFALIHAPDLEHALKRMMSSLPALPAMTPIDFRFHSEPGESGTLVLDLRGRAPDQVTQLLIELAFLLIHRFSSWLIGRAITPLSVSLPHSAPEDFEPRFYRNLYGVAPHFSAPAATILFDRETLQSPVVQTENTLREFLRNSPAVLFSEPTGKTPLTTKVRRMLERGVAGGIPDATTIAERLSMSESHLRRLLRAEGTSVNQLRQEVLCDAALLRLRRGDSTNQISAALGFSEPSAFRRAFKRWTGNSPGTFRAAPERTSAPAGS
ncbi:AraC family transcriptional regulator [Hoyosella subflava]|uniref:Putative AraC family transcriptional regulator n=1 Tax=Hoyosella subflava (strain DSM 45089 / JCM 17490 / NBRC 109087 / DQS3-9A1) TaxID=443218 RepID=F6EM41_HOYSD|nr:AraC family transcriptional regulator [Hoyosella subflava]AEF39247.1 Putative AraC family transcriptional regulator [Hoyosella subflava DQS3-9A1]